MKNFVSFLFCHVLYHVHYIHLENLKKETRCVICPNHSHVFDPTFIYPVADDVYIMAKADLFKNKLLAKLFHHYHIFPINRERTDAKSLLYSLEIFKNTKKRKLLIFPEGAVCKTEEEIGKKVRNGAVFIATHADVPIIPVFITRRPKLFSKVMVIFGEPIHLNPAIANDKVKIKEESKKLIDVIYSLKINI